MGIPLSPVRVAPAQLLGGNDRPGDPAAPPGCAWVAAPVHRQVTLDGEGPIQGLGRLFVDDGSESIPVEQEYGEHERRQQQTDPARHPDEHSMNPRHVRYPCLRLAWVLTSTLPRCVPSS